MSIPKMVLASDDLNARARVLAAAADLDVDLVTVGPTGFSGALSGAALLILDLDRGRELALDELRAVAADDLPPSVVGFLSHVDADLAAAARAAGCETIPRGRFWSGLPGLLRSVT
jgi:hypothetical protein